MKELGKDIKALWQSSDKNAFKSIIFVTVAVTLYFYFGIADFFQQLFPDTPRLDYWKFIYHNFTPIIFFFLSSVLFIKFGLKGKLKDYGLGLGDYKLGIKMCLVVTPIFIIAGLSTVVDSGMNQMYPLARYVIDSPFQFVMLYYISYLVYYVGWETIFRGVTIFGTEKSGPLVAIAVSTLVSALIHSSIAGFGKPFTETFSAIIAGVVFGYVAYKTRSIWYSFYMHVLVGFSTDFFISIFTRAGII